MKKFSLHLGLCSTYFILLVLALGLILAESSDKITDKTKKADDIWADFIQDTGFISKNCSGANSKIPKKEFGHSKDAVIESTEKIEANVLSNEDTKETLLGKSSNSRSTPKCTMIENSTTSKSSKRPAAGGISNVLAHLTKKPKVNMLEKSKLDWNVFKKEQNIEEELLSHNRGKNGFVVLKYFGGKQ